MVTPETYPVHNPSVVGQIIEHEAVLVIAERGEVKVLNEVGARIWELADGSRSVESIAGAICREFHVGRREALDDALEFIAELVAHGVLQISAERQEQQRAP